MMELTDREILDELRRLGVNALSELKSYFDDYRTYCMICSVHYAE